LFEERRRYVLVKSTLVLLAALVLQVSVVSDLPVLGAVGDLLLLVTVAAALVDGADRGATVGFAAGLLYDLVLDTPFGLSALTYALIGYAVGLVSAAVGRSAGWWPVALAAAGGAAGMGLYTAIGHLVGTPYPVGDLPRIALVVAAWNAALIVPVRGLLRRIFGRREPDRVNLAAFIR
jgi:rod shape-determining protein MreD